MESFFFGFILEKKKLGNGRGKSEGHTVLVMTVVFLLGVRLKEGVILWDSQKLGLVLSSSCQAL